MSDKISVRASQNFQIGAISCDRPQVTAFRASFREIYSWVGKELETRLGHI